MLHLLDIIIMLLFFGSLAGMGLYFARRVNNTKNYFLGDGIPAWAIGLSMLSTSISSVTFLAFPAAAYVLDWRQVVPNLMNPVIAVIAVILFVPFFRNSAKTTAFEYLQKRFGSGARLYASLIFWSRKVSGSAPYSIC